MTTLRAIREIVVRHTSEGADKVKREIDQQSAANDQLARSSEGVARVTETTSRRQASAQGAYERLRAQIDRNFRAQQQLEQGQRTLDRAMQQGILDAQEYGRAMEQLRERKMRAVTANDNLARSMTRSESAVGAMYTRVRGLIGVYVSFATIRTLGGMADQWSELQSRVANATGSLEAGHEVMGRITDMAARTYSGLQQTVDSWLANKSALDELGYSTAQQLDLTETLNNSLVISATRGQRAESVMKAWGDAMATGSLRTQGLNTILAGSPRLATALADSLGVTNSQLRQMASNNELTADKLFGVTSQLEKVRREADAMEATLGDGMVRIQNSLLAFVGAADQAGGASSALAQELVKISDWIDENRHLSAAMGDDIARSIATIRELVDDLATAYETAEKALADLHDGVNSLIDMLGLAEKGADSFGSAWFDTMRQFRERVGETVLEVVDRLSFIPSAGKAAYDTFLGNWSAFPRAIGAIVIDAAAKVIETVEGMVDTVINILNYLPRVNIANVAETFSEPFRETMSELLGEAGQEDAKTYFEHLAANQAAAREAAETMGSWLRDAFGIQTREERQIIEAYELAVEWAGKAKDAVTGWFDRTTAGAADVDRAVTSGVTRPTRAAENAAKKAAEAFERQRRSVLENVDALRRHIDTFDASQGATAALEFRIREMARAWEIARAAGLNALPADTIRAIEDAANQIGVLTDRLQRMRLERSQDETFRQLQAEAALVGVSDEARRVALAGLQAEAELRRQNISATDEWGQAYVRNAKLAVVMRQEIDKQTTAMERQNDILRNIASTFLDIFDTSSADSFFDRVVKGLTDIARQFAQIGKNNLMETLFGSGYTSGQPAPGQRTVFPVGVPAAANQNVPLVDTRQLTALNDNLQRSSRSALDVARQFDGLNERADSKVLDSFMQASGQWNNLSAKDTAWCAAFANAAIARAGGQGTGSNLASSFMGWGTETNAPRPGDIVVFRPMAAGASGHVAFFEGFDANGNVRAFGGNQSNNAQTSTFRADQVRSFRTAVRDGSLDAQKAIMQGAVPGLKPTTASAGAQPAAQGGLFGPQGQAMLGVGGAALGSFFGGMQSGNPIMGGLSGAMSGFGAASSIATAFPALGAMAGPIGIIGGAALGLLGGLFGRRRQRREAERQRQEQERQMREQAQQQLDAARPQILELEDAILGRASGSLQKERERIEAQIKQYRDLANQAKNNTEVQRLAAMQKNLGDYMQRLYDDVLLTAESIDLNLSRGLGLESEFSRSVQSVREISLAIRDYVTDLMLATTGSAGVAQAERLVETRERALARERQGGSVTTQLGGGWSTTTNYGGAARIARAERLLEEAKTALGRAREMEAEIAGGARQQLLRLISGEEYLTEVYRQLDGMHGVAAALGVELEKLGMTADEAAAAIEQHLNKGIGRLRDEFGQGIADETADAMGLGYLSQIRNLIERRDELRSDAISLGADPALIERWFQVQVQNLVDGTGLLGDALDPLLDLFPELAGVLGQSMAAIERAYAEAETELRSAYNRQRTELDQTISRLKGFSEALADYRDSLRLDINLSTLSPIEKLTEAQEKFREAAEKAAQGDEEAQGRLIDLSRDYLDQAKSYFASSTDYSAIFDEVSAILAATEAVAREEIDAAKLQLELLDEQVGALIDINESVLSVEEAIAAFNEAQAARDEAQRRAFEEYAAAMLPPGTPPPSYVPPSGMRLGGVVGGYQAGGIVGNGRFDVDSVLARYAGGGHIALAGGEHVTTARGVNPQTLPMLDFINANHRLPEIRMPDVRTSGGRSERELVEAVRRLERQLVDVTAKLAKTIVASDDATRDTIRHTSSAARRRDESAERIAARRAAIRAA